MPVFSDQFDQGFMSPQAFESFLHLPEYRFSDPAT